MNQKSVMSFFLVVLLFGMTALAQVQEGPVVRQGPKPGQRDPAAPLPVPPTTEEPEDVTEPEVIVDEPAEPQPAPEVEPTEQEPADEPTEIVEEPEDIGGDPAQYALCGGRRISTVDCLVELRTNENSMPLFTERGVLNFNFQTEWSIEQIFWKHQGRYEVLTGMNRDGSKAGPLDLFEDGADFYAWGDLEGFHSTRTIERISSFRFRINLRAATGVRDLMLECSSPSAFQGKKLLCTLSEVDRDGRMKFRGYVDLKRRN